MSKKCISCGTQIDDSTSFCLHCGTSQIQKNAATLPKIWRRKTLIAISAAVLVLLSVLLASFIHIPKTYSDEGNLSYSLKNKEYILVLRPDKAVDEAVPSPIKQLNYSVAKNGSTKTITLNLFVYRNGQLLSPDEFLSKVKNISFEAIPVDGGQTVKLFDAENHLQASPLALISCRVKFSAESQTNKLLFTVKMKNGDTLEISQRLVARPMAVLNYYPDSTPLATVGDIEKLLESLEQYNSGDTSINLHLPPVTYNRPLTLPFGNIHLYGSSDGENTTTFTKTLTFSENIRHKVTVNDITFANSEGTGIHALAYGNARGCTFTGCSIGISFCDRGWVAFENCTFANNDIGVLFNSENATQYSVNFQGNQFIGNLVGVELRAIPFTSPLNFTGSVFRHNRTNVENLTGNPVNIPD